MPHSNRWKQILVAACAGLLAAGMVQAKPPEGKGPKHGKPDHAGEHAGQVQERESDSAAKQLGAALGFAFTDRQRDIIRSYYDRQFNAGHCPPGLAKKRNGCMPPGQAKKWGRGRPLPRDVIFHDLPGVLLEELGRAPAGYRFVRVAGDILMIAIGTGLVVDAIEDLGKVL